MLRLLPLRRLALQSFRLAPRPSLPLSRSIRPFSSSLLLRQEGRENQFNNEKRLNPYDFPPCATLYLSNLPFSATPEDLEKALDEFSGVSRINLSRTFEGRSKGFCHVEFDSVENATAVLNAHAENPFVFGEREITVGYGRPERKTPVRGFGGPSEPSNTLYVGNLHYEASDYEIKQAFLPHGQANDVRIGRDRFGGSKGFAHVEFSSIAEAERVMNFHTNEEPISVAGRVFRLDWAVASPEQPPGTKLYFRGFLGDRDTLLVKLEEFGQYVDDIFFLNDVATGQPSGSGFIHFDTVERATSAIKEFSGREMIEGTAFELQYAKPPMERSGGRMGGRDRQRRAGRY